MAAVYGQEYEDFLSDVSNMMASSRLSQRLSRDSGTLNSMHSARSSRIEKPRSNHNSPRTMDRRRTTCSVRSLYGQSGNIAMTAPVDGTHMYNDYMRTAKAPSRPMSWHPASSQFSGTYLQGPAPTTLGTNYPVQISPPVMDSGLSMMNASTYPYNFDGASAPAYSLQPDSTPYQSSPYDSPFYDGAFQPYLDAEAAHSMIYSSPSDVTSWYTPDMPVSSQSLPQSQYPIFQKQQDFLPIQQPPELEEDADVPKTPEPEELERSDSKELIGMGLYDPPATPPHPFMSALNQGKGLKLEEAWAPPSNSDDEEEVEEEAEGNTQQKNQSGMVKGLPTAAQNVARQVQSQWPVAVQDSTGTGTIQSNLQGQTFFFEDGDAVDGEWWYEQLRNPAARVTAEGQGLGYGWLGA